MSTHPKDHQLAAGDGSCARLVASARWRAGGPKAMNRVAEELLRLAIQDTVVEFELLGLAATDMELVLCLDDFARSSGFRGAGHQWPHTARVLLDAPETVGAPSVAALASLHPDGRVRERALAVMTERSRRLADAHALMPFLVRRTTDWAGPVRTLARSSLVTLLDRNPELLGPAAEATMRLAKRNRAGFALRQVHASLADASEEIFAGFRYWR